MTKEQLVEKAKTLAESENLADAFRQLPDLQKQWRQQDSEVESLSDVELADQFYAYVDAIKAKKNEAFASSEDNKKSIIERAKAALEEKNFKKAGNIFNDLMAEWKSAGRSTKEVDDALWEEFSEVRNQFFANRKAYMENLEEVHAKAKEVKEELIQRAKDINALESIKEKTAKMAALMEDWKKSGSAGRNADEALWQEFNVERKAFYAARNAYYDSLSKQFSERAEAKKQIITSARLNLARSEFTDEEIESMKELRKQWKTIGNAGKENEEALWTEFNQIMNTYFENMRAYKG
jgi:hypothetical protein